MKILSALILTLLMFPAAGLANDKWQCNFPYSPTNIVKVLFFYRVTLDYIANAPRLCRLRFTAEVKETVRSTILLTDGCIEATLKDVEEAEAKNIAKHPR